MNPKNTHHHNIPLPPEKSKRLLDPVERVSEILFGLIMALTFTLTISVVEADNKEVRSMLTAALSCNIAWGIVDAVMFTLASLAERGHDRMIPEILRNFVYLPFTHSEEMADQDRSVALFGELGGPGVSPSQGHRDIIKRFGRFPHRNPILGRAMTEEEQRYLDEGGFAG